MSDEKHVALVKQGVTTWTWRHENPNIRLNLSEANLSGLNLSGLNLSRADITLANLRGANLSRAYLNWASCTP